MTEEAPGHDTDSINTQYPQSARVWNYWLGGKDNYAVDREAGDQFCEVFPGIVDIARASRAFIGRAVRYLAGEAGIDQFLDIGTGLPTMDNTHQIAQRVNPAARIVYVDNDPLVLAHARALLTSTPEGVTRYLHADVHNPGTIVEGAAETLDFDRPIAVMLMGILGHVGDYDEARSIVGELMAAVCSGSYLALNDGTDTNPVYSAATDSYNQSGAVPYILRSPAMIAGYFEGLEMVEPGLASLSQWRVEATVFGQPEPVDVYGAVARKP
ncbi:hypothetical protein Acsp03_70350 [Actinomadura sp. NBRC 104412]|uniref:SAM-dependent methyltransferase n=1 Tax=Actinomadura sp. NBRC 104412 TaxID=3032203 RepID=UPI0024A3E861|nr:SAM-dependent methyltransferase [Actinomadura sp. NBRC 104412]GLZ09569.1 hypothetical protein Acsp03_70350 [Actinomadura sp. NBRC 104412]